MTPKRSERNEVTTPKAEEVAAYIANEIFYYDDEDLGILIDLTAEALTQFAEEQRKADHMPDGPCCIALRRARNAALEEAEKICDVIAENYFQVYRASGYKGQGKEGSQAVSAASAKIRALKSKEGA